jgi:hypothetical protein
MVDERTSLGSSRRWAAGQDAPLVMNAGERAGSRAPRVDWDAVSKKYARFLEELRAG